jgi:hypothetical protein
MDEVVAVEDEEEEADGSKTKAAAASFSAAAVAASSASVGGGAGRDEGSTEPSVATHGCSRACAAVKRCAGSSVRSRRTCS